MRVGIGGPVGSGKTRAHAGAVQGAARPYDIAAVTNEAIAGFAQTHLLPLAGTSRALPASGLMAFGPARDEYSQLAARYVDRLLRCAKPGDIPVEQTTRFTLVLNRRAARVG